MKGNPDRVAIDHLLTCPRCADLVAPIHLRCPNCRMFLRLPKTRREQEGVTAKAARS